MSRVHYLAYGSNLHPGRLGARVPIIALLGTAALPGWRLTFGKRGADGSGKCDLEYTGGAEECAYGAVYALEARAKRTLDRIEGLGKGYGERRLVLPSCGEVRLYLALPDARDPSCSPFDWYRALVLAGARYHGFPAGYLARIQATPTIHDPDPARRARHSRRLAVLGT